MKGLKIKAAIYARVSTQEQTYEQQVNNCIRYCRSKLWDYDVFTEKVSGAKQNRRELDRMLQRLRTGEFQAVVCWKLDRLGRSTIHLLQLLEEFRNKDIKLVVTTMGLNTENPEGRFFFSVIAAFAELEREFTKQRVAASLATKRANGIRIGRPPGAKDKRPRRKSGYFEYWSKRRNKKQSLYAKERARERLEEKYATEANSGE
jgi:DNA invertase Pin-like site-specific DNA recombinase